MASPVQDSGSSNVCLRVGEAVGEAAGGGPGGIRIPAYEDGGLCAADGFRGVRLRRSRVGLRLRAAPLQRPAAVEPSATSWLAATGDWRLATGQVQTLPPYGCIQAATGGRSQCWCIVEPEAVLVSGLLKTDAFPFSNARVPDGADARGQRYQLLRHTHTTPLHDGASFNLAPLAQSQSPRYATRSRMLADGGECARSVAQHPSCPAICRHWLSLARHLGQRTHTHPLPSSAVPPGKSTSGPLRQQELTTRPIRAPRLAEGCMQTSKGAKLHHRRRAVYALGRGALVASRIASVEARPNSSDYVTLFLRMRAGEDLMPKSLSARPSITPAHAHTPPPRRRTHSLPSET